MTDNALRSGGARGADRADGGQLEHQKPDIARLKSPALVPNVQIKVVTIPPASSGFIPFARVIHSKLMTIDDEIARWAPATGPAAIWTTRAIWSW